MYCRCDFSEGSKNKFALMHRWVWQCEFGSAEDDIVVEKQIEIDDARAFG
jgi:hypothetical protein